jgi:prepilin-type N-terminal cleavage/methylation domain-containing protein
VKTKGGFSIIETLIAVVIIGIIATAIMSFFPTITRTNQGTRVDQEFTIATKRFMEDVHSAWTDSVEGQEAFDNGTFIDGTAIDGFDLAGLPSDLSCSAALTDPDAGAYSPVQRKRITVTCSAPQVSSVVFAVEFGRPQ